MIDLENICVGAIYQDLSNATTAPAALIRVINKKVFKQLMPL